MTFFFMWNPKQFIDAGMFKPRRADPHKKRETEEDQPEEVEIAEAIALESIPTEETPEPAAQTYTPDLQNEIMRFMVASQQLAAIEAQIKVLLAQKALEDAIAQAAEAERQAAIREELERREAEAQAQRLAIARKILEMQEEEEALFLLLLE